MTSEFNPDEFDFSASSGAEAAKEAKGSGSDGVWQRYGYFGLKNDGDVDILRFLSDVGPVESNPISWITVAQHNFVPTKPAPKVDGADRKGWPKSLTAVCRHDKVFSTRYDDCYICDVMRKSDGKKYAATPRTWALAVRRETFFDDDGVEGLRDKTKALILVDDDGKATGETETVADIVFVNMAYKNFFSKIQGMSGLWGTVLDRDLRITRSGTGLSDTDYLIGAYDPINVPGDNSRRYDLREADLFQANYPEIPDLRRVIADKASDDYYQEYFIPGNGKGATPAAPSGDVEGEKAKGLKARVLSYGEAK